MKQTIALCLLVSILSGCGIARNVASINKNVITTNQHLSQLNDSVSALKTQLSIQAVIIDSLQVITRRISEYSFAEVGANSFSPDLNGYVYYSSFDEMRKVFLASPYTWTGTIALTRGNWSLMVIEFKSQGQPLFATYEMWVPAGGVGVWAKKK